MRKKAFFNIGLAIIVMSVIFFSQSCTRTEDDMDDPPRQDVGDTLWIQDIQRDSFFILGASLALSPDQKTFYYAEGGGNVYWTGTRIVARDVASGSVKWRSDAVDHFAISSQIVVGDQGNIYVTGFYSLFAFDANNGSTLWSWTVPNELPDPQNPQVNVFTRGQIGALALTNDDNQLVAINGNITPSKLTVYNSDGSRDWDVSINGMANFPMLITDNGIIIGIINDHPVSFIPKKLVAIQGNAKLAVDGWPRISHDNRNTSNWNK